MPRTALIVVVPEAEPAVGALRLEHDWSAPLGVPAHVTILFPFAAGAEVEEEAIAEVVAGFPAFDFELNKGYPCPRHKMALRAWGPTTIHRRTWVFMDHTPWGGRLPHPARRLGLLRNPRSIGH